MSEPYPPPSPVSPGYSPVPPPPGQAPGAKRTSPWVWVAVGCGGILLLCVIAFVGAAYWGAHKLKQYADNPAKLAELAVRANPDLEVVSTDDAKKEITFRDKKTNKTMTVSLDKLKNGKIEFESDGQRATINGGEGGVTVTGPNGKATFQAGTGAAADRPSWVPLYPGASAPQGLMSTATDKEKTGTFSISTPDGAEKVVSYYKDQLTAAGLKIEAQASYGTTSNLSAKSADDLRTVSVILTPGDNGSTTAMVTYVEKKAP